jgi:hypothetical protein
MGKENKLKIYTETDHYIHYDYPYQDSYTLCGLDTSGDVGRVEETSEAADCPDCLQKVKFCKKIT